MPAQYNPAVAASLMVLQDGQAFKDLNGVARAEHPRQLDLSPRDPGVIAVFINPGPTPEQPEPTLSDWGDRTTKRPTEYNTVDDKYAREIVDALTRSNSVTQVFELASSRAGSSDGNLLVPVVREKIGQRLSRRPQRARSRAEPGTRISAPFTRQLTALAVGVILICITEVVRWR